MTTPVIAVTADAPYKEIVRTLAEYRISAVPAIDAAGRVTGVVSEADLIRKEEMRGGLDQMLSTTHHVRNRKAHAGTAERLMSSPVITIGPDATVEDAASKLGRADVRARGRRRGSWCRVTVGQERGRLYPEVASMTIGVFLVDDHEIVRRGISDLLEGETDLKVVGEAGTVAEALVRIPAAQPQVAVLDVRLPDGNGVELCRELRSAMPQLQCLMLTSFSDDDALFDAIMAGAAGFLLKQVLGSDLVNAIRTVAGGQSLLDTHTTSALLARLRRDQEQRTDPLAVLSDQERVVLELIGEGLTNRQIAERMFLAEKTVKNYVSHLLAKLGMQRRTQAAVLATELKDKRGS
jgi:DNA-binding NarL/FixJ family response regulator